MYYLGQAVKVSYGYNNKDQSLGVLLGKSITTPSKSKETGLWYRILLMDEDGKTIKPYLFKEGTLGYVYDKKGKVTFGKTKTNTLCVLTTFLDTTDAHKAEVKRLNKPEILEINGVK